ncbi:hypothetical protein [Nonomuraea harbinensis]|uniref:Tetratricopeptide repeat protein n=1 Tax=Nonomuraea harbinensis TaxID=1286938 RepID=A0ABW1C1L5_9ACTN|nr:hypothetical protein [Nonomuraea harbinensis]
MDGRFGQLGRTVHQEVRVESGFAYGVIGADLHVFGDGRPLYLLKETSGRAQLRVALDALGLPAQPSQLLNARHAVVDFTGRDGEVEELTTWRDSGDSHAVRWLHAPGGQGKTRLAAHLAAAAAGDGWKVIVAEHAPAQVVNAEDQTSHDLRLGTARGILMLVDYADRWPLAHLTWLFSNKILDQDVPVRVLLLARNEHIWPALRHALTQAGWPPEACTARSLGPLPSTRDARRDMFRAARDCFARCYGLTRASAIGVPDWLEREEFGLTLAVHMAALVAVDRHVRDTPRPAPGESMLALTAYLLGRESHHWHTLHGTADPLTGARTTFGTDPIRMRRAVFTAVLTGPLGFRDAMAVLDAVGVGDDTDRVLTDHTFCYPPADPRTVLEPLYPDRLAEDFLALCLPGHDLPEHQPEAWAATAPETLLASPSGDGTLPPYAARTIMFLTAACERWPHLIPTLETLERLLPEDPDDAAGDLAVAAADLTERLAGHRLPTLTDPAARAELYDVLGRWLYQAHQEEKAAAALTEATRLYRPLAAADPRTFEPKLAAAAFYLAMDLALGGAIPQPDDLAAVAYFSAGGDALRPALARPDEALAAFREAVEIFRRLARDDPAEHQERLAAVICVAALCGPYLGAPEESLALAREGVDLVRRLARDQENLGKDYSDDVAAALMALAGNLVASEPEQAAALAHEAMEILRRLARDNPAEPAHEDSLYGMLAFQTAVLLRLGRAEPAVAVLDEAVRIRRRLDRRKDSDGRDAWQDTFAGALGLVWVQGTEDDVETGLETAARVLRHEARANPTADGVALYHTFLSLDLLLRRLERWDLVLAGQRDAIDFLGHWDDATDLLGMLAAHGAVLAMLGRWDETLDVIGAIARELLREGTAAELEYAIHGGLTAMTTGSVGQSPDEQPAGAYERESRDENVAMLNEIAAAYRRRSHGDAQERDQGLAVTLKTLAEALWIKDEPWESLTAGDEAVQIRRRLARGGSAEHRGHLALALKRHAHRLGRVGRHEEAAAAAGEAAHLYDLLARDDPGADQLALAATLHLLASNLQWSSPAEALEPAQRATGILERLARDEPATHEPNLVIMLDTLAEILDRLGRGEEARTTVSQAAGIRARTRT